MELRALTRRELLLGSITLGAAGALGYGTLSTYFVVPSFHSLQLFSSVDRPLRFAHISDLHADETPLSIVQAAVKLVEKASPDIIAVTGDFVTASLTGQSDYLFLLTRLAKVAPVFAVVGNHDGGNWAFSCGGYQTSERVRHFLRAAGFNVLHNTCTQVTVRSRTINIVGVGDLWSGEFEPTAAFQDLKARNPTLVLSHNPDSKKEIAQFPWDLMLSGHTHGGQLVVPITGQTPFAPIQDKRYVAGLNVWQDRYINTSRGVGTVLGMRFNCLPEISIIDLI